MHDLGPDLSGRIVKCVAWCNRRRVDQRINLGQQPEGFGKSVGIFQIAADRIDLLAKPGELSKPVFITALGDDGVVVGQIFHDGTTDPAGCAGDHDHLPIRDRKRFEVIGDLE